jgi:hypothetical protein
MRIVFAPELEREASSECWFLGGDLLRKMQAYRLATYGDWLRESGSFTRVFGRDADLSSPLLPSGRQLLADRAPFLLEIPEQKFGLPGDRSPAVILVLEPWQTQP